MAKSAAERQEVGVDWSRNHRHYVITDCNSRSDDRTD
jgi:hypothetical protein